MTDAERLHPDDKRDLKRFMTGQIQNVLANEYKIGGTKTLRGEIAKAIESEVQRQLKSLTEGDRFVERVVDTLLRTYRHEAGGKAKEMAQKAINSAIREQAKEIAEKAVSGLSVSINVNSNFARF
jgi:histone H3/H4